MAIRAPDGANKAKSQMAVPRGEMFDWNVGPNLTEVCHRSCAVKVGIRTPFRISCIMIVNFNTILEQFDL